MLSIDDFVSGLDKAFSKTGFYEHGVVSAIWRYAHISTASSPHESRHTIVSVAWENETPDFPLPASADVMLRAK